MVYFPFVRQIHFLTLRILFYFKFYFTIFITIYPFCALLHAQNLDSQNQKPITQKTDLTPTDTLITWKIAPAVPQTFQDSVII